VEALPRSCAHCGHDLRPEARFCPACGQASAPAGRPPARWPQRDEVEAVPASPRAAAPEVAPPLGAEPGWGRAAEAADTRPRRWRGLALGLAVLALAGVAAAMVFALRPAHHDRPLAVRTGHSAGRPGTAGGSAGPVPTAAAEEQAAKALAALLAQSVTDRSAIARASNDVSQCGPALGQDAQTFRNAAASRQNLLSQLLTLPGRGALPAQLLQNLANAWQASAAADNDLAQWAQDENSSGCTPNDQADPNYQASATPDSQASAAKTAFIGQWNPLAAEFGLVTYQEDQL
jgi:zinc-ribbon domain